MRYLYKINSQYDGFTPRRIPDRLRPPLFFCITEDRFLALKWAKYLDAVIQWDEVWVVFIGGKFEHGVYLKGLVAGIDADKRAVHIRVREFETTSPLTDAKTSATLCKAVSIRYRQVFLWPEDQEYSESCTLKKCANYQCLDCDLWKSYPQIEEAHYNPPSVLKDVTVVPAYWIIPARCFLYYKKRKPAPWNRRVTEMFSAFKVGEKHYGYPLAAGIKCALQNRNLSGFDAIIPIPLSPEKAEAGELDRTTTLSKNLGQLIGHKTLTYLQLAGPISKRRMLAQGYTPTQFRKHYAEKLQIDPKIANLDRILLLDDVITKGTTLAAATTAIRSLNPKIDIVVVAAGQMIVKAVVADENGPAW